MSDQDAFERIIASLHEAMFDDARWARAAALIDEACRTKGNLIGVGDDSGKVDGILFATLCFRGQRHREWEREYIRDFLPTDEHMPRFRRLAASRIVPVTELFSEAELKTSAVYNDAMVRNESQHSLRVRLAGPEGLQVFWGIGDSVDGKEWSSDQVELIERLLPHVRQFVRVRHALASAGASRASLDRLLENTRAGVIQLDRHGQIAAANDRARQLLRSNDGLSDGDGALRTSASTENAKLQKLLGHALPRYGERAVSGSMLVTRREDASAVIVHAIPVDRPAGDFRSRDVAVLLLIIDSKQQTRIEPALVGPALGLTPTEAEVAVMLAEGHAVRDIAGKTGRGKNTVRWHIMNIFNKVGVSRQVELVRLVSAVAESLRTRR